MNELLQQFGDRTKIKLEWVLQTIAPLLEIDRGSIVEIRLTERLPKDTGWGAYISYAQSPWPQCRCLWGADP